MGATLMRTHYPLHPYTHELADKEGVLIWSEVPVYTLSTPNLAKRGVTERAAQGAREEHRRQPEPPVGAAVVDRQRAVLAARRRRRPTTSRTPSAWRKALDPSRPVGLAVAGYPTVGCQPAYAPLDVIGINDYFGWYPGPGGEIFDRNKLSPTSTRCAPATRSRR